MRYHLLIASILFMFSSLSTSANFHSINSNHPLTEHPLASKIEAYVAHSMARIPKTSRDKIELSITNIRSIKHLSCPENGLLISSNTPNLSIGRSTLSLTCTNGKESWKRYASIIVKQLTPVVVSSRRLRKGQVLTDKDMQILTLDRSKIRRGSFSEAKLVAGKKAIRNIGPDQVITPSMLETRYLVEEGDSISILSNYSALSVSADGISLSNGLKGDRVLVRNVRSNRVLKGIVQKAGLVIVY